MSRFFHRPLLPWLGAGILALAPATASMEVPPERSPDVSRPISWDLAARLEDDTLEFRVILSFTGDASGRTKLVLPSHWGGQEGLFDGILDLRAEGASLGEGESPEERILTHEPGAGITVTYRFLQDRPADFSDHTRTHRPILTPDYFHFIGHAAFVHPGWDEDRTRRITLTWHDLPEGWARANSFGEGSSRQVLDIPLDRLLHALYVGGDFRVHHLLIHDRPVVVAIRGEWSFRDEAYTSLVAGIVRAQREFWDDHDFPHFLVTMIPIGTACCSFGGTSVTNAFATFIATDGGLDMRMKHLLAHELLHTWIGQRMRNEDAPGKPEALLYWFSEGFTDYYTRELLLKAGLISPREYVDDLNRALHDYHVSPVRNEPNTRIAEDYWKDRYVQKLPYLRGELLARRWDTTIGKRSRGRESLDDMMRDLLRATSAPGEKVTFDRIGAAARAHLGAGVEEDLRSFIDQGATVPPSVGVLPEGYSLVEVKMAPFDLGFEFEPSRRTGTLSAVREGGPAWEAGLRDGQKLQGYGIRWDDADRPVAITVEIDGRSQKFEYLPAGAPVEVPQFVKDEEQEAL